MDNQSYRPDGTQFQPQRDLGPPPSYWAQQPGYHYPNGPNPSQYPPHPNQHHGPQQPMQHHAPQPPRQQHQQPRQQQQQQQQLVVVGGNRTAGYIPVRQPTVYMFPAILLSCFVFWFCGCLFGLVAFILAMIGHSSSIAGDKNGAMQLRNASYGVSIAGIVIGLSVIAIAVGVSTSMSRSLYRSSNTQYSSLLYNSYYYNSYNAYYVPTYYRTYYKTCSSYTLGYRYYYACK